MKRLKSVLTDDMQRCILTNSTQIHIHHIFRGSRRKLSEKYGYIVPIRYDLHEFGKDSIHENPNKGIDLMLKQRAQRHFEEYHGTRQEFIEIFGNSWL